MSQKIKNAGPGLSIAFFHIHRLPVALGLFLLAVFVIGIRQKFVALLEADLVLRGLQQRDGMLYTFGCLGVFLTADKMVPQEVQAAACSAYVAHPFEQLAGPVKTRPSQNRSVVNVVAGWGSSSRNTR